MTLPPDADWDVIPDYSWRREVRLARSRFVASTVPYVGNRYDQHQQGISKAKADQKVKGEPKVTDSERAVIAGGIKLAKWMIEAAELQERRLVGCYMGGRRLR